MEEDLFSDMQNGIRKTWFGEVYNDHEILLWNTVQCNHSKYSQFLESIEGLL